MGRARAARPDGGVLTVTAVPALHGPEGFEERAGQVIGFVLGGEGLPSVYVSGDNASLAHVRQIAERCGPVDTAVVFAGAACVPAIYGEALLTLDSAQAAEAARILGARRAVVLHAATVGRTSRRTSPPSARRSTARVSARRCPGAARPGVRALRTRARASGTRRAPGRPGGRVRRRVRPAAASVAP